MTETTNVEESRKDKKFIIPSGEDLKELRKQSKLTQGELARLCKLEGTEKKTGKKTEKTSLSQSLIARIENGNVNPSISTINAILKVLYSSKEKTASDILQLVNKWKKEKKISKELIYIHTDQLIGNAIDIMNLNGYSQLPVIDKSGEVVGSITERNLMLHIIKKREFLSEKIGHVMSAPFPRIQDNDTLNTIKDRLNKHSAVLVEKESEKMNSDGIKTKEIVGIITNSDLLRYFKETA